jgi:hypothetical protein
MGCLIRYKEFSEVDFKCPKCGKIQPEIMNINADNKKIEFQCMKCSENEYNSHSFREINENNKISYYWEGEEEDWSNKHWLKEDRTQIKRIEENILVNFFLNDETLKENIKIIEEKNNQLKKLITFNNIIKQSYEKYNNNYLYLKSFKNICKSFENENIRDSNELKFLFTALNNEIEISKKAIDKINHEKEIKINREEECLLLRNKQLNNENIKCLSQIKFNQLIEIDLSENEITNIEPLFYLKLPFLELLDLSYNQIRNIECFGDIKMKQLKYLFIQNNQIEDIKVLVDPNFQTLEILRLENNNIDQNSQTFQDLINLYNVNGKILIKDITDIDEIKTKYNIRFNEQNNEIEVGEGKNGELMLKNLFSIITPNSQIRKLNLTKNNIKNPSILNRIQFNSLKELNLSLNNIKSINFLKKMKAKELKIILLDFNKINDLSLLYKYEQYFGYLDVITFNNNNCPEINNEDLIRFLRSKNIKIQNN